MARLECRAARWAQRLIGGRHGEALAAEIELEYQERRQITGRFRRRLALCALWREISPRLLLFATRRPLNPNPLAPRTGGSMESLLHTLRLAGRSLRRRPGFTTVVVLTLALGIGANTAIFSVVNGVLLRPLPYSNADGLVLVNVGYGHPADARGPMSYPDIVDVRDQSPSIDSMVGLSSTTRTLTGLGEPTLVAATRVSAGLLAVFEQTPALGRDIRPDEFGPEAPAVVVISHGFWQQHFGGRADVLGETITLSDVPYEIVGVAPPGFDYPEQTQLWYPRQIDPEGCGRGCHAWQTIGRLAPGAVVAAAQAELDAIAAALGAEFPKSNLDKVFGVRSLRQAIVGDVRDGLWLLLAAVGAVLLIACANVANLMLARAAARRGEMALHATLGASPRRLAATLMTEALMLALMGGAVGLLLAATAVDALRRLSPGSLPRVEMIALDGTVLAFTAGISLLVALLFGLSPALQLSRVSLSSNIGGSGRGAAGQAGSRRLRSALTAVEMCVSVVLLVAAGLLLKTFSELYVVDLGVETRQVVRFTVSLPTARYGELEQLRATFRRIERDIAALPGVEAVGSVYGAPMHRYGSSGDVIIEGDPPPEPGRENGAALRPVSPGYFETARIPLLAGRPLSTADDADGAEVVVVNETFVRENFPDRDPIGQRVMVTVDFGYGRSMWRVVGVVGDVRSNDLTSEPRAAVYVPQGTVGPNGMTIHVRSAPGAGDLSGPIRERVGAIDPNVPLQGLETMEEVIARAVAPTRFVLIGVGVFAVAAVVLAAVGLYGVTAYLVSRRRREIGIRVALGAQREQILRMVLADGIRPAALGLVAGIAVALGAGRWIESLLFGVEASDPAIFVTAAVLLSSVALAAIVGPATGASRADPARTLRGE